MATVETAAATAPAGSSSSEPLNTIRSQPARVAASSSSTVPMRFARSVGPIASSERSPRTAPARWIDDLAARTRFHDIGNRPRLREIAGNPPHAVLGRARDAAHGDDVDLRRRVARSTWLPIRPLAPVTKPDRPEAHHGVSLASASSRSEIRRFLRCGPVDAKRRDRSSACPARLWERTRATFGRAPRCRPRGSGSPARIPRGRTPCACSSAVSSTPTQPVRVGDSRLRSTITRKIDAARAPHQLDLAVGGLLIVQPAQSVPPRGCGSCCSARCASAGRAPRTPPRRTCAPGSRARRRGAPRR